MTTPTPVPPASVLIPRSAWDALVTQFAEAQGAFDSLDADIDDLDTCPHKCCRTSIDSVHGSRPYTTDLADQMGLLQRCIQVVDPCAFDYSGDRGGNGDSGGSGNNDTGYDSACDGTEDEDDGGKDGDDNKENERPEIEPLTGKQTPLSSQELRDRDERERESQRAAPTPAKRSRWDVLPKETVVAASS